MLNIEVPTMTKPMEYREQRTILHDTHYKVDDHFTKGPQAGSGTLTIGRVVWLQNANIRSAEDSTVTAFAEGIGVVSVEARSLQS